MPKRWPGQGEMRGPVQELLLHMDLHELGGSWLASLHVAMQQTLPVMGPVGMEQWDAVHPLGVVISEAGTRLCAKPAGARHVPRTVK